MAQRCFDNWESLISGVQEVVPEILEIDAAPKAKHILRTHIGKDIYRAYRPKTNGWIGRGENGKWQKTTYQRRGTLAFDVFAKLEDTKTLVVSSKTAPGEAVVPGHTTYGGETGGLLRLLEGSRHGIWRGGFPRPAVKNTIKDFKTNAGLRAAIRNGVKKRIG